MKRPRRGRGTSRIILTGLAVAGSYWIAQSAIDALAFSGRGLADELLRPSADAAWSRALAMCAMIALTVCGQTTVVRQRGALARARESAGRFRALSNAGHQAILVHDQGIILEGNRALADMSGYELSELIGTDGLQLAAAESRESIRRAIRTGSQEPYEAILVRKDGLRVPTEVTVANCRYRGRSARVAAFRDITERKRAEERTAEIQDRLKGIYDASKDAIAFAHLDGTLADFNDAFCRLTGYSRHELLAGKTYQEITPAEYEDWEAAKVESVVRTGEPVEYEKEYVRKDGSRVPILLTVFLARGRDGQPIGVPAIIKDITGRKHAEERLLEYQEQLRALASELSLAEARERRRIAGELHDGIGQSLALAQIKLDALRADKRAGVFAEQIAETRNIIDEAVADVRALTFDLTPPALYELGFVAAARSLCERLENEHGLVIGFSDDGRAKLVSEDVRVILFRALRETLINVIKHAGASHVEVSVARDNEHMHVDVADDGVGFDATQLASDGGVSGRFGLFNVQERLEHVGGRLQVESAPGHGTHVTLVAPLDGSEESVGEASG